uniref:Uncharacterized protein n=1 Tax=Micrurus spixii TaxID=129469 RepID=A0A2D4LUH5_9SAUR
MGELCVEIKLELQNMKEKIKESLEMCSIILQKLEMVTQIEEEQREPEGEELNKEETSLKEQVEQQALKQENKRIKAKNLWFDVIIKGGIVWKIKGKGNSRRGNYRGKIKRGRRIK